jgi:hypothetical protein
MKMTLRDDVSEEKRDSNDIGQTEEKHSVHQLIRLGKGKNMAVQDGK